MSGPRPSRDRWAALADALGRAAPGVDDLRAPAAALARIVDPRRLDEVWLAFAVLAATLPGDTDVVEAARSAQLDPGSLWDAVSRAVTPESLDRSVRVVVDAVVVDAAPTGRVARELVRRWAGRPGIVLTVPADDGATLRPPPGGSDEVLVPWRSHYLLPEPTADSAPWAARLRALAQHSGNRLGAIGSGLAPLLAAQDAAPGLPGRFAVALTVLREAAVVVTLSQAAAAEYRGWRHALTAVGRPGPQVCVVDPPAQADVVGADDLDRARLRLVVPGLPLVLVTGRHGPGEDRLAVLRAADLLYREGRRFVVAFAGDTSAAEDDAAFRALAAELRARGAAVELLTGVPVALERAAARLARFTVALDGGPDECLDGCPGGGAGLEVAESLSAGTPAITAPAGPCAEAAAGGGALTGDVGDPLALAAALRPLLDDDALVARLRAQAAARPERTWDRFAADVWDVLTETPAGRDTRTA